VQMGLIALSFGAAFSFLALRLENELGTGPILIGIAFATQDLTAGVAQPLFGRMADRYDRRLLVALGLAGNAVFLFVLGYANAYWFAVLALALMGASGSISMVAASAMQVVSGRRVGMGTVLGLGSAANGAGILIGSIAGGVLVDQFELSAAFVFGGLAMFAGMFLFLVLTRGVATKEPIEIREGVQAEQSAAP